MADIYCPFIKCRMYTNAFLCIFPDKNPDRTLIPALRVVGVLLFASWVGPCTCIALSQVTHSLECPSVDQEFCNYCCRFPSPSAALPASQLRTCNYFKGAILGQPFINQSASETQMDVIAP